MAIRYVVFVASGYEIDIKPGNPVTICEIDLANTGQLFAYGLGVCKPGDTYNRETGCRKALKSALYAIPRSERRVIWEEYFKLFPLDRPELPENMEFSGASLEFYSDAISRILRAMVDSQ